MLIPQNVRHLPVRETPPKKSIHRTGGFPQFLSLFLNPFLGVKYVVEKESSSSADGDPHSGVCARLTLCSAPY